MEDLACPRCKTTKYRNPALKLMVNVCGHALCENCVELLFVKGSGSCPECNVPLRRNNFRVQLFEDAVVEKEVDIRKRVLRDFNKKEDDFETLRAYNDYLEEVETIIYNLTYNVNMESTRQMIEQYKRDNKAQIAKNKSKLSRDEEFLEELIECEQHLNTERKLQIKQEEKEEKSLKIKHQEGLIDELMFSDAPAGQILATHVAAVQKETEKVIAAKPLPVQFSTGIKFRQDSFLPVPKQQSAPLYIYNEMEIDLCGPVLPGYEELECNGYLAHIRAAKNDEKAGGFVSDLACFRALQEAMSGLYCSSQD